MAWPMSTRALGQLEVSHRASVRCEVWRAGSPVIDSATGKTLQLQVQGGSLTADETSKVRRQITMQVRDVDLMPDSADDGLSPRTTDLKPFYRVALSQGDVEEVPLGVFRLSTPSRSGFQAPLALAGGDYAQVLAAATFTTPWVTPAGVRVVDEIRRMVLAVLPWVSVIDLTGSGARTKMVTWDEQRWDAIESLADGIGCEAAFNVTGDLVVRRVPTTAGPVIWTVDHSTPYAVMIEMTQSLSVEKIYNAVTVTGSDPNSPPVSALVFQKAGPLAYSIGFQRPRRYSSPLVKTVTQAVAAAKAILARSLALSVVLGPTTYPHPGLDVGDVLSVQLPPAPLASRGQAVVPNPSTQPPAFVRRVLSGFTLNLAPETDTGMAMTVRIDADPTVQ